MEKWCKSSHFDEDYRKQRQSIHFGGQDFVIPDSAKPLIEEAVKEICDERDGKVKTTDAIEELQKKYSK